MAALPPYRCNCCCVKAQLLQREWKLRKQEHIWKLSLSWWTSVTKFKCLNFTLPNFLSGANMPKNEISMQKVENWKCESFVTFIIYHQQHGLKFWTLKFKTFLILSMELNLITIKSTVVCLCWKRRPNETVQNDRYFVAH